MRYRVVGPLLVAAAAVGCAQPSTPPGGEIDRVPPRVVEVVPAAFDTLRELRDPVVIRFNERISERLQDVANWEEAVLVSPATSPVEVDAGRRRLEISLVRGWEPDRVYRIRVRPVFSDLFGNAREEPIDVVFSTGAPIPESALAGFITDALTGAAVPDARVEAVRRAEDVPYVAVTDTAGFFAMPFMPAGEYDLRAWVDQDRSLTPDFFEVQDSLDVAFAARDTAIVEVALLRPDTTPARLARAEPVDSTRVRLHFDDPFAPGGVDGRAVLYSLPDSVRIGDGRLLHASRLDSLTAVDTEATALQSETREVLDSLRQAAPPADTAAQAAAALERTARAIARHRIAERDAPEALPGGGRPPLPSQQLIFLAPVRLQPDSSYEVRVTGVTNIQGVAGGGGAANFTMPPAPPPEAVPADTAPQDTLPQDALPQDTLPPDTLSSGSWRKE